MFEHTVNKTDGTDRCLRKPVLRGNISGFFKDIPFSFDFLVFLTSIPFMESSPSSSCHAQVPFEPLVLLHNIFTIYYKKAKVQSSAF
jgi:hypothetical protein